MSDGGFAICPHCHKELLERGQKYFEAYVITCSHYLDGNSLRFRGGVDGRGSKIIREMEEYGYVMSTEFDAWGLIVKPVGMTGKWNNMPFFCYRGKKHGSIF